MIGIDCTLRSLFVKILNANTAIGYSQGSMVEASRLCFVVDLKARCSVWSFVSPSDSFLYLEVDGEAPEALTTLVSDMVNGSTCRAFGV